MPSPALASSDIEQATNGASSSSSSSSSSKFQNNILPNGGDSGRTDLWLGWKDAWNLLRKHGWQRHMGQGIDTHTYYLPPGTERVRGVPVGIPDKDYFISTDLAIAHVQRNYEVLSRVP